MMDTLDISKMADACLRDETAYCTSECPLHIDVPTLIKKLNGGDYKGAFKAYSRQAVFPLILSELCDGECVKNCPHAMNGAAIRVPLLEKACVDYGSGGRIVSYSMPDQGKTVAVIGAGLCGLSCALTLARKGYSVTVYEKTDTLGGSLWDISRDILPEGVINEDFKKLLEEDTLTVKLGQRIDSLDSCNADVTLIATGCEGFGLDVINEISLETSVAGVFLAGRARLGSNATAASIIADGLRAAQSIERFTKGASLTLRRDDVKAAAPRRQFDVPPTDSAAPENGLRYTREEASREAARCSLCECRACINPCEFLTFYRTDPKTGARDVARSLNAVELLNEKIATRMTNACSDCGLCKAVCPESIDMGRICMEAKRVLYGRSELPEAFHDFWLRDMEHSWSDEAYLLLPEGAAEDKWLFFPGCQLSASIPESLLHAFEHLKSALTGGLSILLACCGAPADWSAHSDVHDEILNKLRSAWELKGRPTFILACPSCMKIFNRNLPEIPVVSLWEVLENNIPDANLNKKLAVYDPCAAREFPEARRSVRGILEKLTVSAEELPYSGTLARCCGYGGLISTVNPALAEEIRQARVSASPLDYVTYCSNCRDSFLKEGKSAYHLLELLFSPDTKPSIPRISERRENRRRLKELLLGCEYRENAPSFQLLLDDDVLNKLDDTLTLKSELEQTLQEAESSGTALLDEETGHIFAHSLIGITTIWIEYTRETDGFRIHNFYRHFMRLTGGVQ